MKPDFVLPFEEICTIVGKDKNTLFSRKARKVRKEKTGESYILKSKSQDLGFLCALARKNSSFLVLSAPPREHDVEFAFQPVT
ncbi:MAG: hypothetical protein M0Z89_08465 [Nitrospiraceae bacterium]|nr:hypothetical protein [Nitrospiraceae bacterium]